MRKLITAAMFVSLASLVMPAAADAAPCRDAKGKFIKCPAKHETPKKGPCKDAKGRFTKCTK